LRLFANVYMVLRWAAVGCILTLCAACAYLSPSHIVEFSPDGRFVAYVMARQWDLPLPPEMPTIRSTVYVMWRPLSDGSKTQSVKIDSFGRKFGFWGKERVHLAFAPDSRHLSVVSPRRLMIIDVETGKNWNLTRAGDQVTSCHWLGSDEIGYVLYTNRQGDSGKKADRLFVKQGIHDRFEAAKIIHRQSGVEADFKEGISQNAWPIERWSPDGRFVIFTDLQSKEQFRILEVMSGALRSFGHPGLRNEGVAWHPEGTWAFCIGQHRLDPPYCWLLQPQTGGVLDLSDNLRSFLAHTPPNAMPLIEPLWTRDGRFVIANVLGLGGCLISPKPWDVIPLAQEVITHLRRSDPRPLSPYLKESPPFIRSAPLAGWVRIGISFESGPSLSGEDYLADYTGTQLILLGPSRAPGFDWSVTLDGRQAVSFKNDETLEIRSIDWKGRVGVATHNP
jgi:hypothetical protein